MNTAIQRPHWSSANQALMVAEFARLRMLLGDEQISEPQVQSQLAEARAALKLEPAAIDELTEAFALSGFERALLLLCAGVEMDTRLVSLAAHAEARTLNGAISFGLALSALPEAHWSALAPVSPLRYWRLVNVDTNQPLTSASVRIDERILHYLAGVPYLDGRLQPLLRAIEPSSLMADQHRRLVEHITTTLHGSSDAPAPVQLHGNDSLGQEDVAARAAARFALGLYAIKAADLPQDPHELQALIALWQRESVLVGCALMIEAQDEDSFSTISRFVEKCDGLLFVATREPHELGRASLNYCVNRPGAAEQRGLWKDALGMQAKRLNGGLERVVGQFRLSARMIEAMAGNFAAADEDDADTGLWNRCRSLRLSPLSKLAQRIEPMAQWDDLVLPESELEQLCKVATQVRYRLQVYEGWGFAKQTQRGLGISALFAGESGTGKTMAAEVLANELRLDLYRIDLASVVSKYIGETEKNLRQIFDAAEESGAILLFDEADALFGKRSEVKDSHDRYANIEVSYLLQRMEAYRGLAILTTNQKAALDPAFSRRLRFIVQFPFPDEALREAIWRRAFPALAPLDQVDPAKLARLNVAGGHIRNMALSAAFLAAEAGEPISMRHLFQAAHSEAAKRERAITEAETRGWL